MTFDVRPAPTRFHTELDWLDSWHSFSFGSHHDPRNTGHGLLIVNNDDVVRGGGGFGTHGHRDMEILTWVLSGALEHRDNLGTHGVIRPGEAQVMSAGTGIRHSEFNASATEPVHFLQIWILPQQTGLPPRYGQVAFQEADLRNSLHLIASPDGAGGSVKVLQDLRVFAGWLDSDREVQATILPGRAGFLQVATGEVSLNGVALQAGDGARIEGESSITVVAGAPSEILYFDLA